jgi:hypothetical protein
MTDDSAQMPLVLTLRVLDRRAVRLLQTLEAFLPHAAGKREVPTFPAPLEEIGRGSHPNRPPRPLPLRPLTLVRTAPLR